MARTYRGGHGRRPAAKHWWSATTLGTTSTTAIDPLPGIGAICREYGVWLHVDAAYAGARGDPVPSCGGPHAGVEYADSYCFDPHKWLLTGFDRDVFWVADRAELILRPDGDRRSSCATRPPSPAR